MEHNYYLNYFRDNFDDFIEFYPEIIQKKILYNNLYYGKDDFSNICIVTNLLKSHFNLHELKYNITSFDNLFNYQVSKINISLNINNIHSSNRKHVIDFINMIASTRCLIQDKHIFFIQNFDLLSEQQQSSMRRVIEKHIDTTIFLLTSTIKL